MIFDSKRVYVGSDEYADWETERRLYETHIRRAQKTARISGNQEIIDSTTQALGKFYNDIGFTSLAKDEFNRIITGDGSNFIKSQARVGLADAKFKEGDYLSALRNIDVALRIDPNNIDAINKKGQFQVVLFERINSVSGGAIENVNEEFQRRLGVSEEQDIFSNTFRQLLGLVGGVEYESIDLNKKTKVLNIFQAGTSGATALVRNGVDLVEYTNLNSEKRFEILNNALPGYNKENLNNLDKAIRLTLEGNSDAALIATLGSDTVALRLLRDRLSRSNELDGKRDWDLSKLHLDGRDYIASEPRTFNDLAIDLMSLKTASYIVGPIAAARVLKGVLGAARAGYIGSRLASAAGKLDELGAVIAERQITATLAVVGLTGATFIVPEGVGLLFDTVTEILPGGKVAEAAGTAADVLRSGKLSAKELQRLEREFGTVLRLMNDIDKVSDQARIQQRISRLITEAEELAPGIAPSIRLLGEPRPRAIIEGFEAVDLRTGKRTTGNLYDKIDKTNIDEIFTDLSETLGEGVTGTKVVVYRNKEGKNVVVFFTPDLHHSYVGAKLAELDGWDKVDVDRFYALPGVSSDELLGRELGLELILNPKTGKIEITMSSGITNAQRSSSRQIKFDQDVIDSAINDVIDRIDPDLLDPRYKDFRWLDDPVLREQIRPSALIKADTVIAEPGRSVGAMFVEHPGLGGTAVFVHDEKYRYLLGRLRRSEPPYAGGLEKILDDYVAVNPAARTQVKEYADIHRDLGKAAKDAGIPFGDVREYLKSIPEGSDVRIGDKVYEYQKAIEASDFHDLSRNEELKTGFEHMGFTRDNPEILETKLIEQVSEANRIGDPIPIPELPGHFEYRFKSVIEGPHGVKANIETRWTLSPEGDLVLGTVIPDRPPIGFRIEPKKTNPERISPGDEKWLDRLPIYRKILPLIRNFN